MAETTKIEWTATVGPDGTSHPGATFNPWLGCMKLSAACDHCYAEGWAKRAGNPELWTGERRRTTASNWQQPRKWNARAARDGVRLKVFCASLADVFDNQADPAWRADLWQLIAETPNLDWLLLTKRPQNIKKMLPDSWGAGWSHVWLGTTVENQEEANRRIPHLLATPAAVRFLSVEPLLGPVQLADDWMHDSDCDILNPKFGNSYDCTCQEPHEVRIDWVIVGGESGPQARPMHPDWARSLRDQCAAAGVPFFFKQHGEWVGVPDLRNLPGGCGPGFGVFDHSPFDRDHEAVKVGKKRAGRLLDGREHNDMPTSQRG